MLVTRSNMIILENVTCFNGKNMLIRMRNPSRIIRTSIITVGAS